VALSLTTIGNAASIGGFLMQVQAGLQSTVTAVLGEAGTTPDYVVRRKFAQKVAQNLPAFSVGLAVAVAAQIKSANPTKYNDLTGTPIPVADADVTAALSAIFTQQAYAYILPS